MIDRVQANAISKVAPRRRSIAWLGALAVVLILLALVFAPKLFASDSLRDEIAEQVRHTTGLSLRTDAPARFLLLPQPHVELARLHLADPSGTLTIDAASLNGEVRLLPLLVGRIEVASATLDHPQLGIDLDGRPMPADSMIGRALRATGAPMAPANQRLGIVTLVDGTAIIKSKSKPNDSVIKAINVTVDWRNLDAPATLTGTVEFKDVPTDVAAWVAQPSSLLRGDHSQLALRIQSIPLDLSANGDFAGGPSLQFHGRFSANAPTLAAVLNLVGHEAVLLAPFANVTVVSELTVSAAGVDLQNLHLRLDGNDYEGALAFQDRGTRASLTGTLATDQLSLAPFLNQLPPMLDDKRQWTQRALQIDQNDRLDLDLRVSATRLRVPPLALEDAALSVMTRDNRTEIVLADAKGYGGTIKGRASLGQSEDGLSLRGTVALSDVDASALSWDVFGRQLGAGTLTASANVESSGASPLALMSNLHGSLKSRVLDGELSNVDLGRGLRELTHERFETALLALRDGHTAFETFDVGGKVSEGIATIEEGSLKAQDVTLDLGGQIDLGKRLFDLKAVAAPRAAPNDSVPGAARLRLGIQGGFDQPSIRPDVGSAPATPPAAKL